MGSTPVRYHAYRREGGQLLTMALNAQLFFHIFVGKY